MNSQRPSPSISQVGLKKGAKIGLYLSLAYALAFPFIWFYTDPSHKILKPDVGDLIMAVITMPFYGLVVGCIPATIVGGGTGWLVGKVFSKMPCRLTAVRSLFIGLIVAIGMVLLFNAFVIFDSHQPSPWLRNWSYLTLLGIPTLVYIVATPVASYQFYRQNSPYFTRQK